MKPLHSPLKSLSSIRLLTLYPGLLQAPLRASLKEVILASAPAYEALSYTWGPPGGEKEIFINDIPSPIRPNLWQFLQRLRSEDKPQIVWVDALSISQTDLDEKARQVALIGQIFKSARRVRVWLGEHADGSEKLFGGRNFNETVQWYSHRFSRNGSRRIHIGGQTKSGEDQVLIDDIWVKLLRRPYFFRTWIVQEIVHASEIIVHCGPDTASWTELIGSRIPVKELLGRRFVRYKYRPKMLLLNGQTSIRHVNDLQASRLRYHKPSILSPLRYKSSQAPHGNIFDLMEQFNNTRCSDPRDNVYALLSLADLRTDIGADYSLSLPQLFLELCHEAWAAGDGLYETHTTLALNSPLLTSDEVVETTMTLVRKSTELGLSDYESIWLFQTLLRNMSSRTGLEMPSQLQNMPLQDVRVEAEKFVARFCAWQNG